MAIVLSKTYALICAAIVTVLTICFFFRSDSWGHIDPLAVSSPGEHINAKWQEYQFDCGMKRSFGNPIQVQRTFEAKYDHKNVDWEGEVLLVREGSSFLIWDNPSMMAIRMDQSYDHSKPDIIGLFSKEINEQVAEVNNGDRIKFNATCLSPGARGSTLIVKIWSIEKLPPVEDDDGGLPAGLLQMLMNGMGGTGGGIISMTRNGIMPQDGNVSIRRVVIGGPGSGSSSPVISIGGLPMMSSATSMGGDHHDPPETFGGDNTCQITPGGDITCHKTGDGHNHDEHGNGAGHDAGDHHDCHHW